jgi:hypothetical protein
MRWCRFDWLIPFILACTLASSVLGHGDFFREERLVFFNERPAGNGGDALVTLFCRRLWRLFRKLVRREMETLYAS